MKKYDLTRILVEGNHLILKKFVAEIEQNYEVVITKLPEKGLVMMKTNDSVSNQPFYLGELLVTECTVSVNESIGFGIIIGEKPEEAYQLAVIDASFRGELPETKAWIPFIEAEEKAIDERLKKESELAVGSRVNFDMMGEYDGNR